MSNCTWANSRLISFLRDCWQRNRGNTGHTRTIGITQCFISAVQNSQLRAFRPDAIWTALQNVYYEVQASPFLEDFRNGNITGTDLIEELMSVRQGWVRSSGVALEKAYERIYNPHLSSYSPLVYLIGKSRLRKHSVGKHAVNLGVDKIGSAREDDAYLITINSQNRAYIFGAVQFKSSLGDRADQGGPRSSYLMERGYFSIVHTLDPMEVRRSPRGMLVHGSYIDTVNGVSGRHNMWHYVYIARRSNLHRPSRQRIYSRIKEIDLGARDDLFLQDVLRAAREWLGEHSIPITWR